jgi:hypothetical protein
VATILVAWRGRRVVLMLMLRVSGLYSTLYTLFSA